MAPQVSPGLLAELSSYALRFGKLDYVEALLGSVARHANLSVLCPPSLANIIAGNEAPEPSCAAVRAEPEALWHSVRNQSAFMTRCRAEWKATPAAEAA
jgi:hypothetical protein